MVGIPERIGENAGRVDADLELTIDPTPGDPVAHVLGPRRGARLRREGITTWRRCGTPESE